MSTREKLIQIAQGKMTLVEAFNGHTMDFVLEVLIQELFHDQKITFKREPKVYFIQKREHNGEYYETKPFYSSVLTEEEVAEIELDVPDIRKRLTKFVEVIEE